MSTHDETDGGAILYLELRKEIAAGRKNRLDENVITEGILQGLADALEREMMLDPGAAVACIARAVGGLVLDATPRRRGVQAPQYRPGLDPLEQVAEVRVNGQRQCQLHPEGCPPLCTGWKGEGIPAQYPRQRP